MVLRKEDYDLELNQLVGDIQTYKKLSGNPIEKVKVKLTKLVKKVKHRLILTKKEARYLVPETPRLPVINQLPKIHKNRECPPRETYPWWDRLDLFWGGGVFRLLLATYCSKKTLLFKG